MCDLLLCKTCYNPTFSSQKSSYHNPLFCSTGEVQQEVDHIFELAKSLNLLVLECDTINHPSQLQKSTLAPIVIYLKIASAKVSFLNSFSLNGPVKAVVVQCYYGKKPKRNQLFYILDSSNSSRMLSQMVHYWRKAESVFITCGV